MVDYFFVDYGMVCAVAKVIFPYQRQQGRRAAGPDIEKLFPLKWLLSRIDFFKIQYFPISGSCLDTKRGAMK